MSLFAEARALIREYLDGHKLRSIAQLARSSGIPPSTVRRIAQGEAKDAQTETIVAILSVFMAQKEIQLLLKKYGSAKTRKNAEILMSEGYNELPSTEGFYWEKPDIYILALAQAQKGVSKEKIEKEFGAEGLKRLEVLLDSGFLKYERSGYVPAIENYVDPYGKSVLNKIALCANSFDLATLDKGCFYQYWVEPISEDQKQAIIEATKVYRQTVLEIAKSQSNSPRNSVFMIGLTGTFISGDEEAQR